MVRRCKCGRFMGDVCTNPVHQIESLSEKELTLFRKLRGRGKVYFDTLVGSEIGCVGKLIQKGLAVKGRDYSAKPKKKYVEVVV